MNVVFMGTPQFAVPVLEAIIKAGHEVKVVVTQPDKPKGRGKAVTVSEVKEAALKYNIPVFQPKKIKEAESVAYLETIEADIFVVAAFGQILSKQILDMPRYGCICVHASLLPKYRGAAPIQWSIIDGEQETGVTIMQMDAGIDTGDMLLKEALPIEKDDTGKSLDDKLSALGANLCVKAMKLMEEGKIEKIKQDDTKSCYAKMLTKDLGRIDWSKKAVELERLIRALNPWPSVYSYYHGKTIKIWAAKVLMEEGEGTIGEIIKIEKDVVYVKTGEGLLGLTEIQLEGKKRMTVEAFLLGYKFHPGEILE